MHSVKKKAPYIISTEYSEDNKSRRLLYYTQAHIEGTMYCQSNLVAFVEDPDSFPKAALLQLGLAEYFVAI